MQMYVILKRILDVGFSIFLSVLLAPLFLFIPILVFITMGLPVFFCQGRIGMNNNLFKIYKFRTMREGNKIDTTDEQRITCTGRILRLFRIDELPQLLNIFKGDMSFIGPRPLLPDYLLYYTTEEIRRHKVRPGLSGYSQNLNYPKWEDQFKDDIYYVDNISFKLDLYILTKTISKIVRPSLMMKTGISGGRPNFDKYRKKQIIDKSNFESDFDKSNN